MTAATGTMVLSAATTLLRVTRRLFTTPGAIIVSGSDADLIYAPVTNYVMIAEPGAITVTGHAATLRFAPAPPPPPLNIGRRAFIPNRW
jgi:hypothetical protein